MPGMLYIFVLDVGGSVAALDDPRCDRAWTKPGESLPSASGYARRDWLCERERERERFSGGPLAFLSAATRFVKRH